MTDTETQAIVSWNKGKLVVQKRPHKLNEIWAIRVRIELAQNHRELALFNLAIYLDLELYFLADWKHVLISQQDSMRESYILGLLKLDWTRAAIGHILCAVPNQH